MWEAWVNAVHVASIETRGIILQRQSSSSSCSKRLTHPRQQRSLIGCCVGCSSAAEAWRYLFLIYSLSPMFVEQTSPVRPVSVGNCCLLAGSLSSRPSSSLVRRTNRQPRQWTRQQFRWWVLAWIARSRINCFQRFNAGTNLSVIAQSVTAQLVMLLALIKTRIYGFAFYWKKIALK